MRLRTKLAPWVWILYGCLPVTADEPPLEPIPFSQPLQIDTTDLPADEPAPIFEILPESADKPSSPESGSPGALPANPDRSPAAPAPPRGWRPSFAAITEEPPTLPPQGYRAANSNITYSQRWVFDARQGVYVPESITVVRRAAAVPTTRAIEQTPNGTRYRAYSQPYGATYAGNQQAGNGPIQAQVIPTQPRRRPERPAPTPGHPSLADETAPPPTEFVPGQPIRNAIRRRRQP